MRRLRILIHAHGLRTAGGSVVGTNILKNLSALEKSNEYLVIVPDSPAYRGLQLDCERFQVHYYSRRWGGVGRWLFDNISLRRLVWRFSPDVACGLGNLGLSWLSCPQAIMIHNPNLVYDRRYTGRLTLASRFRRHSLRRILRHTDLVFCQTRTMEARVRQFLGFRGRTIITENVLSEFVDASKSRVDLPAQLLPHKGKFRLLYLTRYYPHKGLELIVEAMDSYRQELCDVVAVFTIDPKQHIGASRLLERIRTRRLEDRVVNVGPLAQEELARYYAACDCLIMPTRLESFSGAYLESMHFGLPILTSDLDFAHEVCCDTALYFDPWNAQSIKDTILLAKRDPELLRQMAAKGKERLTTHFRRSWADVARTVVGSLESLVEHSQAGPIATAIQRKAT